jgi:threonine dehydrogenase-like Zn-dependent dehydrogenase
MALALELFRSAPRYLAARAVGAKAPGLVAGPLAPLRLANRPDLEPRDERWTRVKPRLSGICGSDLSTLAGKSSFYFSPLVSLPFVPGHEVVGDVMDDVDGLSAGDRVVLSSVLNCATRGLDPCENCRVGAFNRCDAVTTGDLKAGLQTGYCTDTGGGWSRMMLAHRSQLHRIPDSMEDDVAVLLEPFACAIHAALRANVPDGGSVFVVGAGTVGILTLLAVKLLTRADHVIVAAKHPAQRVAARLAGADVVVVPEHAVKAVRRSEHAMKLTPERGMDFLLGGVDVAIESTGSKSALDLALRTTRAGGRVVLSGIPGPGADLTPVWFRELELAGAYTSGTERVGDVDRPTMEMAIELASGLPMLADMVGARYRLDRWRDAVDHALGAGRLGTFKVAFAPQET